MNALNSNSVTPFQEQSPATGITASVVPNRQRLSFWPTHFGSIPQWIIHGTPYFRTDGPLL